MSGQGPTENLAREAVAREILAGEYVLGMVDARTAASVAHALPTDAALRQAVEAWEDQLTGLSDAIPQEAPPPELWDRIAARLPVMAGRVGALAREQRATAEHPRGVAWLWRAWAVGATFATVVFAGLAVVQTQRHDSLEATLARPGIDRVNPGQPAAVFAAPPPTAPAQVQQAITGPTDGAQGIKPAAADVVQSQPGLAQPVPGPVVLPAMAPDTTGVTRPASGGAGTTGGRPSPADGTSTIRR